MHVEMSYQHIIRMMCAHGTACLRRPVANVSTLMYRTVYTIIVYYNTVLYRREINRKINKKINPLT